MDKIIVAIILGGLFGFALFYAGASSPKKLIRMLRLQDLSLMKIIVFAIGLSSVLLAIANFIGIFDVSHLSVKSTHLGVIIGGLLFGVGFGTVGTCPGTCVAATSSGGFKKAISAVVGGLLGAWVFSLMYETFHNWGLFGAMNLGKLTLFQISDKYPSVFSVGYIGLFIVGLLFIGIAMLLPMKGRKEN